jgi:hypothetical protein
MNSTLGTQQLRTVQLVKLFARGLILRAYSARFKHSFLGARQSSMIVVTVKLLNLAKQLGLKVLFISIFTQFFTICYYLSGNNCDVTTLLINIGVRNTQERLGWKI